MIKACLKICLAALLYLGLEQLIELKTRGFCLQRILSTNLPSQTRWEVDSLSSEEQDHIEQLLEQPFHMLGAGSECFAFLSTDGKTVIKFFKLDQFRPVYLHRGLFLEDHSAFAGTLSPHPFLEKKIPSPLNHWINRLLGIREWRLQRTFKSIHLAYRELKEQTGLIYLHLNPGGTFKKQLTVYDSCKIAHHIDLNDTKFVLQQRATPLMEHFESLVAKQSTEEMKESIDTLLDLLLIRCQKGISDRDIVSRNFGYLGNTAIEIDAGSFIPMGEMKEKWLYQQELVYATLELKLWLKSHCPQLTDYLEDKIAEKIT